MEEKIAQVVSTLKRVYGACPTGGGGAASVWIPKSFAENKSRYLWTDAYGVVNFLNLFCLTRDQTYLQQGQRLIQVVHDTLGKTRDGKKRLGQATDEHPTLGGLRIGKPEAEGPSMNEDGQYYHYLTKWMFALNRATIVTKDPKYNTWAIELATSIHPYFIKRSSSDGLAQRMYWKISLDLSRPLVGSEGGLDSYDGYVTYCVLRDVSGNSSTLTKEINDMKHLIDSRYSSYRTSDPLDAGEALWLCAWRPDDSWARHVAKVAKDAVNKMRNQKAEFDGSPRSRLAFREFGTTIGVQMHRDMMDEHHWTETNDTLHKFWLEHLFVRDEDITPVMYCASLCPGLLDPRFKVD